MASYPYYTEPTHETGVITTSGTNYARDTDTSSAEGRLKVDVVDKLFLLEPTKHPFTTLLTNVGKVWDGQGYKGSGLLKASTGNPELN